MRNWRQLSLAALILLCVCVPEASALTIVTRFIGGAAPANTVGGGNLETVMRAAAGMWASAYRDEMTLTLNYGWANTGDAGTHSLVRTDALGREISGTVLFDNSGSVSFYLDPTPDFSEEYRRKTEEYQNLGNGMVNVARLFSNPSGEAAGHLDLLSVALHEIGHSLGMSAANSRFLRLSTQGILTVSSDLPFEGSLIPLAYNNSGVIAHFDPAEIVYGSVMTGINGDERRIPSELDVLANAQVSGFTVASLNPQQVYTEILSQIRSAENSASGTGSVAGNGIALGQ